jgi:CCR4-NOT transcriptional regulation complex NOT5 subunit
MKEDIDYYLESNQEPEFEGNEFLYDDIEGLEEFEDGLVGQPVGGTAGEEGSGSPTSITPTPPLHSGDASDPEKSYALDNVKSSGEMSSNLKEDEHTNVCRRSCELRVTQVSNTNTPA